MSIDRSNNLRSQTGLWSGEKFRNADVDRPVDEMEIENLDQYNVSATGCLAGWAGQCGARPRIIICWSKKPSLWAQNSGHRIVETRLRAQHSLVRTSPTPLPLPTTWKDNSGEKIGFDILPAKDKSNKLWIHKLVIPTWFCPYHLPLYKDMYVPLS